MNTVLSLNEILTRPDVWCADRLASAGLSAIPTVSSGFAELDAELPGGGWPRGALTEVLADGAGFGECSLLLPALRASSEDARWSLLLAPPHGVDATAWASRGIDLARLAVVAPKRPRDVLWAAAHALASGAVGTLLCWTARIDAAQVRRLQVAAAGSATLAFLFRPRQAQTEASAASLRLALGTGPRGTLAVDLLKRRGPPCARTLYLPVARPLPWREDYESFVACPASAAAAARSQRSLAVA
ncbi:MAG: translesion DNA synthesis-associated protein ImuA [Propionivibrio sp.]